MNKVDSFFVLILVLLSGLAVTYKVAQTDLGDVKLNASANRQLMNQIKRLQLKQKDLELALAEKHAGRSIASVAPVTTTVHQVELNPAKIAEGVYKDAVEDCIHLKKTVTCLEKIDSVVSQFPESPWAGKALLILTSIYIKEKKYDQAYELVKIVRNEFKDDADVQRQLKDIEKTPL